MVDAYETGRPDRAHLLKFNIEKIEQGYRFRCPMAVWVAFVFAVCAREPMRPRRSAPFG